MRSQIVTQHEFGARNKWWSVSPDHLCSPKMLTPCKQGLKKYSLLAGRNHPSHPFWPDTALYSARESFPAVGLLRLGGIKKRSVKRCKSQYRAQQFPFEDSYHSALHYYVTLLFPTVMGAFQSQDDSVIAAYRKRPADSQVKPSI